jgi:hypothetical protein
MSILDPDLRPSASVDEALERLSDTANGCIDQLIVQCATLRGQRNELRDCLREAKDGFISGRFITTTACTSDGLADFAKFIARCHAALARSEP